jgi:iron complex outermembrane receptor protein
LQDEVKITSRLTLNAGLRHDQYQRYGGNTSPRAALIYRLRPKTTLKLLFGSAFRVPNVYEAYYGTKSASLSGYKLNPNLHPESIKNYEAGWEQTLGQSFRLTTSVFRSNISDLISLQLDPNDNMNFFRNAADAHSTGAEIEAEKNFDALLTSRLSYTFARTSYDSSDQSLADSPRHLAKLNLSVPLRRDRWFGSLEAQYESARRASDGSRVGGFPILNGTFLARSLARHLNLSASLYNLLDRHYADPVSSELPESAIPQDGRSFRVKLTWSLGE